MCIRDRDRIVPALTKEFGYKTVMQVPVLKKIVINQGLGMAAADKMLGVQLFICFLFIAGAIGLRNIYHLAEEKRNISLPDYRCRLTE